MEASPLSRLPHRLSRSQHPRRPGCVAGRGRHPCHPLDGFRLDEPELTGSRQIQRLGDQTGRGRGVAQVRLNAGGFHQRKRQQDRGAGRAVDRHGVPNQVPRPPRVPMAGCNRGQCEPRRRGQEVFAQRGERLGRFGEQVARRIKVPLLQGNSTDQGIGVELQR